MQYISAFIHPGGSDVIGIGSPRASCEANFALLKLVEQENFCSGLGKRDQSLIAAILQILSNTPARVASLKEVEGCDAVFILGEDISNTAPRLALALHRSVTRKPMAIARNLHIPPWDDAAVREAIQEQRGPLFIATPAATVLMHLPRPHSVRRRMTWRASGLPWPMPCIKQAPPVPDAYGRRN